MRASVDSVTLLLLCIRAFFRTHREQAIVELALRQQLATYAQKRSRPRIAPLDRAFWVALSRIWPRRRSALVIVEPDTAVRWHRVGFHLYWRSISKAGAERPPISEEVQVLICRPATEIGWRARKVGDKEFKRGICNVR